MLRSQGKRQGRRCISIDVAEIRKLQLSGLSLREIASRTGWSLASITRRAESRQISSSSNKKRTPLEKRKGIRISQRTILREGMESERAISEN